MKCLGGQSSSHEGEKRVTTAFMCEGTREFSTSNECARFLTCSAGLSAPAQSNGGASGANNGDSLDLFGAPADQKQQPAAPVASAGPADLMDFGDLLSTSSPPGENRLKYGCIHQSCAVFFTDRLAQVPKSQISVVVFKHVAFLRFLGSYCFQHR